MNQAFSPKIVEIDSFKYVLDEQEKTAGIAGCAENNRNYNIVIPTSFTYKSQNYTITSIQPFAFKSSIQIWSIQFSYDSNLQTIGEESFKGTNIRSISIPPHVTIIGKGSFSDCTQLSQVIIPDNSELQIIEEYAFSNTNINTFTIPKYLTQLGAGWCFRTPKLEDVNLNPKNRHFQFYQSTFLLSKSSPSSEIYDLLHFCIRGVEKVVIPNFVRIIGPYAFSGCRDLLQIDYQPDSNLHTIGRGFISNTKISNITIPEKVTQLESGWLELTNFLKIVKIDDRNTNFSVYEKTFILGKSSPEKENFDVLHFSVRDVKTVLIPRFIEVIGNSAFRNCMSLKKVEFEEDSNLRIIEDYAFVATPIKKVSIPKKVTCIGKGSFAMCSNLDDVKIPPDSKIDSIDEMAFNNMKIESLVIHRHVKYIHKYAFKCCDIKIIELEMSPFDHNCDFLYYINKNTLVMIPSEFSTK